MRIANVTELEPSEHWEFVTIWMVSVLANPTLEEAESVMSVMMDSTDLNPPMDW